MLILYIFSQRPKTIRSYTSCEYYLLIIIKGHKWHRIVIKQNNINNIKMKIKCLILNWNLRYYFVHKKLIHTRDRNKTRHTCFITMFFQPEVTLHQNVGYSLVSTIMFRSHSIRTPKGNWCRYGYGDDGTDRRSMGSADKGVVVKCRCEGG